MDCENMKNDVQFENSKFNQQKRFEHAGVFRTVIPEMVSFTDKDLRFFSNKMFSFNVAGDPNANEQQIGIGQWQY